jgi:hypothetical protein
VPSALVKPPTKCSIVLGMKKLMKTVVVVALGSFSCTDLACCSVRLTCYQYFKCRKCLTIMRLKTHGIS